MKQKSPCVYILSSKPNGVLYLGVTSDLIKRIWQHKNALVDGFSKKYNCHFLIYFEEFKSINSAIKREKEIKGWRRDKKDKLIKSTNPQLNFLNEIIKGL